MKRIDIVLESLKNMDNGNGVTTLEISKKLNLERSNISKDLNLLVKEKKIFKQNSRPVKYFINNPYINKNLLNKSNIDNLTLLYPSLQDSVILAKTAIMYPPNGMNSLIIGDTGVGKSMLAKLMHEYACDFKRKKLPYIHFNCSDYATNPQLLVSHLFGVKKGTFTGATTDKIGLIEKANDGIIFLDEIHNLTNEGQEMLFIYMDTGYFRRLGEVSEQRKSSAMIICATNKDINSNLLATFIRRIPIKINLPSLEERNLHERFSLIEIFLKEESKKINEDIFISKNALLALLLYKCTNNIGQLKNDITLAVANSYFEYIVHNKKYIKINSIDLPNHIRLANNFNLTNEKKALKILNKLNFDDNEYIPYNLNSEILKHNTIKIRDDILNEFSNSLISICNLPKNKFENNLDNIFSNYINILDSFSSKYKFKLNNSAFVKFLNQVNSYNIAIIDITKFESILKIHIDMIYDRMQLLNLDVKFYLNILKNTYPSLYDITSSLYSDIENIYNVSLSDIELLSLFLIFAMFKNNIENKMFKKDQ